MKTNIRHQGGSLTIYSFDRSSIVGELSDGEWIEETSDGGVNYVLRGLASEGTLDTVLAILESGISSVAYDFVANGQLYQGNAMMLKPVAAAAPASTILTIESPEAPKPSGQLGISGATAL